MEQALSIGVILASIGVVFWSLRFSNRTRIQQVGPARARMEAAGGIAFGVALALGGFALGVEGVYVQLALFGGFLIVLAVLTVRQTRRGRPPSDDR